MVYNLAGLKARRRVTCTHGLHPDAGGLVEEGGETFEDQIDGIAAAMRGQGGLAVGDFNYTACSKWREGGASALSGSDRLFRAFAGRACACCPKKARAPISSVLVQQAEGELWTHKAGPKAKGKSKIELKIIRDQDQRKMGSSLVFQRHCDVSRSYGNIRSGDTHHL